MTRVGDAQAQTYAALVDAIEGQKLPKDALKQATSLRERLESVTRVTLLGNPSSGKSAILNILAGTAILPVGLSVGTVQLVHGKEESATVTLRDGSNVTVDAPLDMSQVAAMNPAFVKVESPIAALTKISLLEIVTTTERVEQIRAIKWATKQTDIAIWCTQEFDSGEQALWANVPDSIKDHAILAMSKADRLGKHRAGKLKELAHSVGSDFAHVIAISAEEAQAARADADNVDKKMLKASGATSLISTILRQIENGRQFAADQAEILLHQYRKEIQAADVAKSKPVQEINLETPTPTLVVRSEAKPDLFVVKKPETVADSETLVPVTKRILEPKAIVAKPAKTPTPKPTPEPEVAEKAEKPNFAAEEFKALADLIAVPTVDDAPEAKALVKQAPNQAPKQEAKQEPAKTQDQDSPTEEFVFKRTKSKVGSKKDAKPAGELLDALREATSRLSSAGQTLKSMDDQEPRQILDHTVKTISWLSEHLSQDHWPAGSDLDRYRDMAQDAEDLVQLLRIEGGEDGALDAVTTLLQLKRGFQAELAA